MSLVNLNLSLTIQKKRAIRLFISTLIAIGGGVIVAWGQPSHAPWLAMCAGAFGYIPIFYLASRASTLLFSFILCSLWSFGVTLIELSWMSATTYHGIYILIVYVALSLALALQFGLLGLFVKAPTISRCVAAASLWMILEWSRLYFLCGFAFKPVGLALSGNLTSIQLAALFGVYGLSFFVMLTNFLGLRALRRKNWNSWALWIVVAGLPYVAGMLMSEWMPLKGESSLKALLVQTGLHPHEKIPLGKGDAFIHPVAQWESILQLIQKAENKVDLIVLPESALPFSAHKALYRAKKMPEFIPFEKGELGLLSNLDIAAMIAKRFKADLLIGLDDQSDLTATNSAFLISKSNIARYDKQILVPLAEYLPFNWLKPMVARYGITSFFAHGQSRILEGKWKYGPTICYEECFPHLVRRYKKEGAQLLVNLTNDSYFPNTKLPQAHFDLGRIRAVENGLPLLRCCNNGITAAIDATGKVIDSIEGEWTKAALYVDIPLAARDTLYSICGDLPLLLLASLYLLFLTSFRLLKKRGGSKFLEKQTC